VSKRLSIAMIGPGAAGIGGVANVMRSWEQSTHWALHDIENYVSSPGQQARGRWLRMAWSAAHWRARLASGYRPDLLHVHMGGPVSYLRERLYTDPAQAHRVPIVCHVHGFANPATVFDTSPFYRRGIRRILRQAAEVLVVAEAAIPVVEKWAGRDLPITVVRNAIAPPPHVDRLYGEVELPVVLFMGWMTSRKGVFDLLDAIPMVRKEVPKAEFVFAGDGVDLRRFQKRLAQRGYKGVHVMGWVQGQTQARAWDRADVFCLPSHAEGMPISVLEAMGYGLPVVATEMAGIPEQVIPNQTGFLYPPGNVRALAQALIKLLRNPKLRQDMGTAGRRRLIETFDLDTQVQRVHQVWERAAR
jgi:glycosyltransferase involved in cell wall biosynthesis